MTLANSKIWYNAFVEQGRTAEAEEMLSKHPELAEKAPKKEPDILEKIEDNKKKVK